LTYSETEPAQTSIRPLQLVPKPTQTSINSFIQKPITISKPKKIDSQISKLIIKHYHPFSLIEEKEFKKLIHLLAPGYTFPSRKTIANSLIPQLYESTVTEIKHKLKNIQAICLTTDAWISINNQSFIALTAHYIDDNTKLSSILLGCHHFLERHTAVEMSSFLKDLVKKWNLDNLVTMVVNDNASNILAAIKLC